MKAQITRLLSTFLFVIPLLISQPALAQTLFLEENFDFESGSVVSGQNAWTVGTASANRVLVSTAGLTYPDYPNANIGKAAVFVPTTDRIQKNFDGSLTGTYYYSFLINVTTAGSGDFFIGFYSNSAFRGRTYLKSDGTGFQFGLTKTTTGPVVYTSGTPFSFGTTYCVVVKYEFLTGSGTDDKVSMYVNPDFKAAELPTTATIGPLTDAGNDVTASVFAIQGRANSGSFTLDGVRVAPSWGSIRGEVVVNHFLELPKYISSKMVLQRETPLKFKGWGTVGDTVKVTFNRGGTLFTDSIKIDEEGRWKVELPSQLVSTTACSLSFEILHHPETKQSFDDILVGDVWFAGGQSNMEKKVSHLLEATQVIAEADNYPMIRSFRASYNPTTEIQERVNGSSAPWFVCNSTEVGDKVSAVAYIFALEIYKSQNIPIGIMQSYRGGTELETWMSGAKINSDPELCKVAGRIAGMDPTNANNYPSINYNGQIHPLTGFPIKGFIFYQGESNTKRALEYRLMMKKLIEDWRNLWKQGNLPFYYVQMFNMGISANQLYEEGNWQDLREQQEQLLTVENIPNIGMAVSIDTNEDPNNADDMIRIHPKNKLPVGERLAKIALKNTYQLDIVGESPVISNYRFANDSAIIVFKNVGTGLKIKTNETELKGFVLAGSDKAFKSATATIINDSTVIVKSNFVSNPVSVRYAWAKNPVCNLYNSADLPASPFRTDNWNSGFSYQNFASTCAASNDAGLIAIKVNGVAFPDFNPTVLSYHLSETFQQPPTIVGYPNNPFASIATTSVENHIQKGVKLNVTAENGNQQSYVISYNNQTSSYIQLSDMGVTINLSNQKLTINNTSAEVIEYVIFSTTGQRIYRGKINSYSSRTTTVNKSGVYLLWVYMKGTTYNQKLMIYEV